MKLIIRKLLALTKLLAPEKNESSTSFPSSNERTDMLKAAIVRDIQEAIRDEKTSYQIYMAMSSAARAMGSPLLEGKLQAIAKDEQRHLDVLEEELRILRG